MKTVTRRISALTALAASLLLWSCDNLTEPTQPGLAPSPMVVMSTSGTRFVVAVERNPTAGTASASIGSGGGVILFGKHALYVPKDAVKEATTFKMTRSADSPLLVDLTATRKTDNDIGSAGFATPVYLVMSYGDTESLPADENSIEVVYIRPDGLVEEMPSVVNTSEDRIIAALSHFSPYAVAWP